MIYELGDAFWESWTPILFVSGSLLLALALAVNMIGPIAAKVCFITANALLFGKLCTCKELNGPPD
jgi:hypothetical protein